MSKDIKTIPIEELYPLHDGSCRITVGCRRSDYSASRIANAVEDCDAQLLNLNVAMDDSGVYDMLVDLRINRASGEGVARSLGRYGFDVIGVSSPDGDASPVLSERIEELLRYINI